MKQRQKLLFMHCSSTVHVFKNIKNGSHDTIYTFKNYFATVFLVFSFRKNKLYPNGPLMFWGYQGRNIMKFSFSFWYAKTTF